MTGLEKILDRIKSESEASVNQIISEAEEKCREIKAKAEADADAAADEIKKRSEDECGQIIKRAESSADHKTAQNLLRKKREIIDEVIRVAEKRVYDMSDKDYFEFISKLLDGNAPGGGEIIFNAKDKARLPSDFELKGHKLSGKTGDFSGGFIIDNGDVEINCTVSALFEGAYDVLSDAVNVILFREV